MDFHFANVFEAISDLQPERAALICDGLTRSWREYDDRAARLASVLASHGLGQDSKVGLYLHNCNEYQEAQFAVFKIRGCPINVNYRYKADELIYLLDNADAEAVVFQATYAARIWEIRDRLPKVKLYIQVDDGTEALLKGAVEFEKAIRTQNPMARIERSAEDVYMLYTGGTTGMPKGVMYPGGPFCQFFVAMGLGGRGVTPPTTVEGLIDLLPGIVDKPVSLPACPLMHGTGVWLGSFMPMILGGTVVTTQRLGLDSDHLWGLVEQHRVSDLVIVGDAFAKPLLDALDAALARGNPYNTTSLRQIISSGVMWSAQTKTGLLKHGDFALLDVMGSTEGGMGSSVTTRSAGAKTAKFALNAGVRVFADDDHEVLAGSGEIGRVATSAFVPLGYFKDPEKSAATFRQIDGVRYSFPGDYAQVEADGTITLLGRGSACINTGGEKVFPEEVEEAVKQHPDIFDCLVVGVPDDRFGERIVAVASYREQVVEGRGCEAHELIEFARGHLSGYKVPRSVLFVDVVRRAPNGKADYKWARQAAINA
jgi:3-oxocholest-4-en-26-oate---CoA ligase